MLHLKNFNNYMIQKYRTSGTGHVKIVTVCHSLRSLLSRSKTYITGMMSGGFSSNNRDRIRLQVITFGNQVLPGKLVVFLKSQIQDINNKKM